MRLVKKFLLLPLLILPLFSCANEEERLTLTLDYAVTGNDALVDSLASRFPEVDFDVTWYKGRNPATMLIQKLEHADESDLVFTPSLPSSELQETRLLDLCSTSYPNRFDATTWKDYTISGHVYLLPGPLSASFLAYNQTLFEEKGWELPKSLDDLVSLAKKIRTEATDVTPLSIAGASLAADEAFFESLIQNESSFKSDGYSWLDGYVQGTSSCQPGIASSSAMLKQLVEAKAFSTADGIRWRGEAYDRFFNKRQSAFMYVYNGQSSLDSLVSQSSDSFSAIALPGFHKNNNLLSIESTMSYGISKRLAEKGNEKKKEKALEVIDYLSSEEGMKAMAGNQAPLSYPLKGVSNKNLSAFFQNVFALSDTAIQARSISEVFRDVSPSLSSKVQNIIFNGGSILGLEKEIDNWHQSAIKGRNTSHYAEIGADFTADQTAQFAANVIKGSSVACDVAVVAKGEKRNGIINEIGSSWGRLYQGTLDDDEVSITVPKDGGIITAQVPGSFLIPLLNKGRIIIAADKTSAAFPLFFSGMEATWEKGQIVNLTVNGLPLEESQTYTLAYIGAKTFDASFKEVAAELQQPVPDLKEIDSHIQIINAFSGYLENRKGQVIYPPALSR